MPGLVAGVAKTTRSPKAAVEQVNAAIPDTSSVGSGAVGIDQPFGRLLATGTPMASRSSRMGRLRLS